MKSNRIIIDNRGNNLDEVLREIDKFTEYQNYPHKQALRLRLLGEESIGLVTGITGEFSAYFSLEGDEKSADIIIEGKANIDTWKRSDLFSISKSGKNILAKGISGKIRSVIEAGVLGWDEVTKNDIYDYGVYTNPVYEDQMGNYITWSLNRFKDGLGEFQDQDEEAAEAYDELERSIVANLADDVEVGILKGNIRIVVKYKI